MESFNIVDRFGDVLFRHFRDVNCSGGVTHFTDTHRKAVGKTRVTCSLHTKYSPRGKGEKVFAVVEALEMSE